MDVAALLRRTGLPQRDFATLVGVSQPAVAQWLAGTRRPGAAAVERLARLAAAAEGPTKVHPAHRGRPVELPACTWRPVAEQHGLLKLPNRLDWTPRRGLRDLDDPDERAGAYAQVLDEGTPFDVRLWVDPDLLADAWPDVPVARHLRGPVAELVDMIRQRRDQ